MTEEVHPPAIDDRKASILRAIVEEYVATAQPVGSQTVARRRQLGVSAATVRNDMGILEREGYIVQPHTSAGRVPTDLGYRYYVDRFAASGELTTTQRREVAEFFESTSRAIEDLLHDTSQLLARLADHAAVVVGPQPDAACIRHAQLVLLEPRVVLAVVVLSNGAVEKETIVLDSDADGDLVARASTRLADLAGGQALSDLGAPEPRDRAAPDPADELVRYACVGLQRRASGGAHEPVFVGGASRLAAEQEAFATAATPTRLLELLEQHVVVASVVRDLLGPGLTVRIGSENELDDLRECSLVLAPYFVEGEPAGSIGLLGPTRMDYRRAHAAVTAVSRLLGRQLSR